ncbi:hypothetical protein [Aquimarina sp. Aq78]|uniref:hypothetical protein n=1 Tax=Aquimarina sp. Aq78 TaxID=1191889 RepID=UPI000D0FEC70|nr:hypothetical protein [Aquimarina sp. Aq78]
MYFYVVGIFTDHNADIVQIISLPLELIGFALAFIEVRKPSLADRIEKGIDILIDRLFNIIKKRSPKDGTSLPLAVLMHLSITIAFLGCFWVCWKYVPILYERPKDNFFNYFDYFAWFVGWLGIVFSSIGVLMFAAFIVITILLIILKIITRILNYLDRYAHGRALGAFGLILALFGVIGEIFQVTVMIVS